MLLTGSPAVSYRTDRAAPRPPRQTRPAPCPASPCHVFRPHVYCMCRRSSEASLLPGDWTSPHGPPRAVPRDREVEGGGVREWSLYSGYSCVSWSVFGYRRTNTYCLRTDFSPIEKQEDAFRYRRPRVAGRPGRGTRVLGVAFEEVVAGPGGRPGGGREGVGERAGRALLKPRAGEGGGRGPAGIGGGRRRGRVGGGSGAGREPRGPGRGAPELGDRRPVRARWPRLRMPPPLAPSRGGAGRGRGAGRRKSPGLRVGERHLFRPAPPPPAGPDGPVLHPGRKGEERGEEGGALPVRGLRRSRGPHRPVGLRGPQRPTPGPPTPAAPTPPSSLRRLAGRPTGVAGRAC